MARKNRCAFFQRIFLLTVLIRMPSRCTLFTLHAIVYSRVVFTCNYEGTKRRWRRVRINS